MDIFDSYQLIRESVVAFVAKDVAPPTGQDAPQSFPPILGTGVAVREDGLVVTNDHVIAAIGKAVSSSGQKIAAVFFKRFPEGMVGIPVDLIGNLSLTDNPFENEVSYGPKKPDLGFIRIAQRGIPPARFSDSTEYLKEGAMVGTAGFPLGNTPMRVAQMVGPTLQSGIISAVFPYSGFSSPHGFAINVMSHPGSSGSPVFSPSTAEVLGIVWGGFSQVANFTFVVPSRYVIKCLTFDLEQVGLPRLSTGVPEFSNSLDAARKQMIQKAKKAQ